MKKFTGLFCLIVTMILISVNSAFAASTLKNFYAYEVRNVNIREFGAAARASIDAYGSKDNYVPLTNVQNAYIYTGKDCTYFIRLYPANNNTNIFVVSNEEYDVRNNDLTAYLKQGNYSFRKLDDSDAMREYKFDFYTLARQKQLGNFYISPDLIKPLKTGMSKLNNKMAKNQKKTSVIPYSVDNEPIDLTCVDTTGFYDEDSKIAIMRKEYRLKQKANKYVHAYEYILTNNNDSTATVTATSERLASVKDIATETFVDLDRLDMLDTVGSFPPVLVCTAGLSVLCSVPNWVRLARTTKEATRYAHALPDNYKLRSQGRMRVLVLKYKSNPKPVNFNVNIDGQAYNLSF